MELKRDEIIKALECCGTNDKSCSSCPLAKDYSPCSKTMADNALALIKEQTEENERLEKALNTDISIVRVSRGSGKTAHLREVGRIRVDAIRADTVREMQERLTDFFNNDEMVEYIEVDAVYINEQIEKIAKEMLVGL